MAENGETPATTVNNTSPATPAPPSGGGGGGEGDSAKSPETPATPDAQNGGTKNAVFRAQFKAFSKFGDTKSDGKHITLSQSDKWMKQAKVIGKVITTTDTGIYFKKFKAQKINMEDYNKFLEELAKNKKTDITEIKNKLSQCGAPGLTGVHSINKPQPYVGRSPNNNTNPGKSPPNAKNTCDVASTKAQSTVERLTDVSRYTGAHKQRFDETGKGRGIAGRKDVADTSGYVHGYQNKDTYSKMH